MKKIMKKVVALVAVTAITATTLVGCASGNNVDNSEVVATVGDSQITAGVANFYLRYQQSGMEELYAMYFGENFWKTQISDGVTYGQDLKNQVMDSLHEFYVLEDHMAEYDVAITEEELVAIDKAAEGFVAANSEKVIKNISGQKENVAEVLRLFTINEKMFKAMTAEVDREVADDEAVQKRIRYYSKSKLQDGTTDKLPEDELEKVKGEMELFLKGAKANGSMEEFGKENDISTYSLTFDKESTAITKEVIDVADKLKEGEFAEVIDTESFYYVVQLESEFDKEATEAKKEVIVGERETEAYSEVAEKWLEDTEIEVNKDVWGKISVEDLKVLVAEEKEEE